MPWLAALVCCSAVRPGPARRLRQRRRASRSTRPTRPPYLTTDLAAFLTPAAGIGRRLRRALPGRLPRPRPPPAPRLAPGGRQRPARAGRPGRRGAGRRLPGPAAGLDPARRADLPQGQAPRRRRRLGLRAPGAASGRSPSRRAPTGSPPTSTAPSPTPATSTDDPRPPAGRAPPALRDAALRRAALPLRAGAAPHRRPQRLGAQAALHGRERPRLAPRAPGPRAGLDRRRAQDLQDPDGGPAQPSAGPGRTA